MNIDLQAREIKPQRQTFQRVAAYIGDKPASRYEEATLGVQPSANFHYRPTWEPEHELFDAGRTAITMADWYALRDPRQYYYANWTMARAKQQDAMEANYDFVESRGLVTKMSDSVRTKASEILMPLRHVAWAGNMNNCSICARGWGTAFTAPAMFHAMDHLGVAQYLTRLGLALGEPEALQAGKNDWLGDSRWQVLRRYVEDTLVLKDPFELFVAQNLALNGLLYPLIFTHFVDDRVALQGGTAVAMLCSFMPEWHEESARWIDAVVKVAAADNADNLALITGWYQRYTGLAQAALAPVANAALGAEGDALLADVRATLDARARKAGLAL
ncbi:MAG: phenol hydroxylase [Comamonas sp. SCN 65-56]|uniref:phenol hydroxylase n=1 Tax=Comamonas sp. SCN 65-56 TaxID=1660095 RepID=UPI0008690402|nr:phenol hydroxylase [Comamonas sp. SCN 65-56]ODS93214.1 MAG: phenol hydroxylase [Comamonas sp. SCN 65-56]